MPYQRTEEPVQLLVSVYLTDERTKGTIIAVLCRSLYPVDNRELARTVERAALRLKTLTRDSNRFAKPSIDSAKRALKVLRSRIPQDTHAA